MHRVITIQERLKAPKGRRNSFGNYNYRSCEDILEAVKPLLAEEGILLTLADEMVLVGDRYYVKATATLQDAGNVIVSTTGYAREAATKKGMDDSQITGTASSYARKYALNALFLIDDTKDADTDEYTRETEARNRQVNRNRKSDENAEIKATDTEKKILKEYAEQCGAKLESILEFCKIKSLDEMTAAQHGTVMMMLKQKYEDKK